METTDSEQAQGLLQVGESEPRLKRKRNALLVVVVASVLIHLLGLGAFGVIKIVETIQQPPPEFEAVVEAPQDSPPPPPPSPMQRLTQRSMARPEPLAAQNPLDLSVPAIEFATADMAMSLSGRGGGSGLGRIGGGTLDSIKITSFGFDQMLEGTLEGVLFDFKTDPRGEPIEQTKESIAEIFTDFSRSWSIDSLERKFFKADTILYASYFVIPFQSAGAAPRAFNAEGVIRPEMIGAVYSGTFTPKKTGRFRFYGRGDDVLIVRINNRIVLDASWDLNYYSNADQAEVDEEVPSEKLFSFGLPGVRGPWFSLREGRETHIDILIAEVPGNMFGAWLTIEERRSEVGPQIFHTRPLSQQDRDYLRKLHPDSAELLPVEAN